MSKSSQTSAAVLRPKFPQALNTSTSAANSVSEKKKGVLIAIAESSLVQKDITGDAVIGNISHAGSQTLRRRRGHLERIKKFHEAYLNGEAHSVSKSTALESREENARMAQLFSDLRKSLVQSFDLLKEIEVLEQRRRQQGRLLTSILNKKDISLIATCNLQNELEVTSLEYKSLISEIISSLDRDCSG